MITLQRVRLQNFMSIDELEMTFDEDETIVITGDNGSGKSALVAAIAMSLVGYRKGDSYKDFIQRGESKAQVELDILVKGIPLESRVTISNEKYTTPLSREVVYEGQTYHNSEVTTLLAQLDIQSLEHIMFLFQRESSIVDLRPSERASLLKQLFHFEFEDQIEALKLRIEQTKETLTSVSTEFDLIKNKTIDLLELDRALTEEEYLVVTNRHQDVQNALASLQQIPDIEAIENKYKAVQGLITDKKRALGVEERRLLSIAGTIGSLETALGEFKSFPFSVEDYKESAAGALEEANQAKYSLLEASLAVSNASTNLQNEKSHLEIHLKGECHVCGQDIPGDLIEKTKEQVRAKEEVFNELKIEEEKAKQFLEKKEERASYAQKQVKEAEQAALAKARVVANLEKEKAAIPYIESNVAKLKEDLENLFEEEAIASTEVQRVAAFTEALATRKALEEELQDLNSKIQHQVVTVAKNEDRVRMNEKMTIEKTELEKRKDYLLKEIAASESDIITSKEALRIFEKDLPNFVILKTCSHLENIINSVIQHVFPSMQVKLSQSKQGVEFFYTTDNEDVWSSAKMASGAQSSILTLAWRIAVARLYGVTTILLDEIDSDATDENSKAIYEFISSLNMFKQILLISHRKESVRAVASLTDNVTSYFVSNGEYEKVASEELFDFSS